MMGTPACDGRRGRVFLAELVGTALFVLGALSSAALVRHAGSARLALTGALVATVVSTIALSPVGRVSGAHLNPALTLAFRALGRVADRDLASYLPAQLLGALGGGLAFKALWGRAALAVGGGVTHPAVSPGAGLALEAAMTALLVGVIVACVSSLRLARFAPVAIWPVLTVLIWLLSPDTGTSLNPARSAGPAVAFVDLRDLWLYVVGPCAGALVATLPWLARVRSPRSVVVREQPRQRGT
jgi:aquaporin Z